MLLSGITSSRSSSDPCRFFIHQSCGSSDSWVVARVLLLLVIGMQPIDSLRVESDPCRSFISSSSEERFNAVLGLRGLRAVIVLHRILLRYHRMLESFLRSKRRRFFFIGMEPIGSLSPSACGRRLRYTTALITGMLSRALGKIHWSVGWISSLVASV